MLLLHLALERKVWSFGHEYGRNYVHNIWVGCLVNHKTLGGGGGGGGGLQPPEPPWDIGTSPTEYENLILLFSSDSFDLGFYSLYCYRFLFLAPPNLFLVHSVFHIVTEDGWLYSS